MQANKIVISFLFSFNSRRLYGLPHHDGDDELASDRSARGWNIRIICDDVRAYKDFLLTLGREGDCMFRNVNRFVGRLFSGCGIWWNITLTETASFCTESGLGAGVIQKGGCFENNNIIVCYVNMISCSGTWMKKKHACY